MSKKSSLPKASKTPKDKEEQDNANALPGWPGYRTRAGRSGYDPIDSRTEAAHTFGVLARELFTGQLKVGNPVLLFLLGALGLIFVAPLFLAFSEMIKGSLFSWDAWINLLIMGIMGFAALINCIKNLARINQK